MAMNGPATSLLLLTILALLLIGFRGDKEGEMEERIQGIERVLEDLKEQIEACERREQPMKRAEKKRWDDFFEQLDKHNGEQSP